MPPRFFSFAALKVQVDFHDTSVTFFDGMRYRDRGAMKIREKVHFSLPATESIKHVHSL